MPEIGGTAMSPEELDVLFRTVRELGLAITLVLALIYVILWPRKTHDGKPKSAVVVPGWVHDRAIAEAEAIRDFYKKALKEEQDRSSVRVQEWRGFRDEERAARIDAENDRKAVVGALNDLTRDVALLLEIQQSALRDGAESGAQGAPPTR